MGRRWIVGRQCRHLTRALRVVTTSPGVREGIVLGRVRQKIEVADVCIALPRTDDLSAVPDLERRCRTGAAERPEDVARRTARPIIGVGTDVDEAQIPRPLLPLRRAEVEVAAEIPGIGGFVVGAAIERIPRDKIRLVTGERGVGVERGGDLEAVERPVVDAEVADRALPETSPILGVVSLVETADPHARPRKGVWQLAGGDLDAVYVESAVSRARATLDNRELMPLAVSRHAAAHGPAIAESQVVVRAGPLDEEVFSACALRKDRVLLAGAQHRAVSKCPDRDRPVATHWNGRPHRLDVVVRAVEHRGAYAANVPGAEGDAHGTQVVIGCIRRAELQGSQHLLILRRGAGAAEREGAAACVPRGCDRSGNCHGEQVACLEIARNAVHHGQRGAEDCVKVGCIGCKRGVDIHKGNAGIDCDGGKRVARVWPDNEGSAGGGGKTGRIVHKHDLNRGHGRAGRLRDAIGGGPRETVSRWAQVCRRAACPVGPRRVPQSAKVGGTNNLIHCHGFAGIEAAAGVGVEPERAVAGQGQDSNRSESLACSGGAVGGVVGIAVGEAEVRRDEAERRVLIDRKRGSVHGWNIVVVEQAEREISGDSGVGLAGTIVRRHADGEVGGAGWRVAAQGAGHGVDCEPGGQGRAVRQRGRVAERGAGWIGVSERASRQREREPTRAKPTLRGNRGDNDGLVVVICKGGSEILDGRKLAVACNQSQVYGTSVGRRVSRKGHAVWIECQPRRKILFLPINQKAGTYRNSISFRVGNLGPWNGERSGPSARYRLIQRGSIPYGGLIHIDDVDIKIPPHLGGVKKEFMVAIITVVGE